MKRSTLLQHLCKHGCVLKREGGSHGELLALAAPDFDVFLTSDRNLSHQQNLSAFDIAVIVLVAVSNRLAVMVDGLLYA